MSWLADVLSFEGFNGKKIFGGIAKDPSRLLTGIDPASTGAWNAVTGSHKHALVDQMGGARGETYKQAKDAGINTGPGRFMQNIAHVIAGGEALSGLAGIGGAGGAGAGAAGEGGGYLGEVGLTSGELTDGAGLAAGGGGADVGGLAALDSQAVAAEGAEPGLTTGYGQSSSLPSWLNGKNVNRAGDLMQKQAQQQQQQRIDQSRVAVEAPTLQNPYATSSKAKKTGARVSMQALLARGAQPDANPVDANGVAMASIQELTRDLGAAKRRLAKLEGAKK